MAFESVTPRQAVWSNRFARFIRTQREVWLNSRQAGQAEGIVQIDESGLWAIVIQQMQKAGSSRSESLTAGAKELAQKIQRRDTNL